MKTYSVGDLKARFSEILDMVREGKEIAIALGKKKKIVAWIVPESKRTHQKRKLGALKGKGKVVFHKDWEMTEEELFG